MISHIDMVMEVVNQGFQKYATPFLLVISIVFYFMSTFIFCVINKTYVIRNVQDICRFGFENAHSWIELLSENRKRYFFDGIYETKKCPFKEFPHMIQWSTGWLLFALSITFVLVIEFMVTVSAFIRICCLSPICDTVKALHFEAAHGSFYSRETRCKKYECCL